MTTPESWQKSSFSGGGDGDACIELASTPDTIHLRESDIPATHITTAHTPSPHSSTT